MPPQGSCHPELAMEAASFMTPDLRRRQRYAICFHFVLSLLLQVDAVCQF